MSPSCFGRTTFPRRVKVEEERTNGGRKKLVAYIAEREGGERRWPTGELKFFEGSRGKPTGLQKEEAPNTQRDGNKNDQLEPRV